MHILKNQRFIPYCVTAACAAALLSGCSLTRTSTSNTKIDGDPIQTKLGSSQSLDILSSLSTDGSNIAIVNQSLREIASIANAKQIGTALQEDQRLAITHLTHEIDSELKGTNVLKTIKKYLKNDPEVAHGFLREILNDTFPNDTSSRIKINSLEISNAFKVFKYKYESARRNLSIFLKMNKKNPKALTAAMFIQRQFDKGTTSRFILNSMPDFFSNNVSSNEEMKARLENLNGAFVRFQKAINYSFLSKKIRTMADKILEHSLADEDYVPKINRFIPCLREHQDVHTPLPLELAKGLVECFSKTSSDRENAERKDAFLETILPAQIDDENSLYIYFASSTKSEKLSALKFFATETPESLIIARDLIDFSQHCPIFPTSDYANKSIKIMSSMEAEGEPITYQQNSFSITFPRAFNVFERCLTWPDKNCTIITSDSGNPAKNVRLHDLLAREIGNVTKGTSWSNSDTARKLDFSTLLEKGIKRDGNEFSKEEVPAINVGDGLAPLSFENPTIIIYVAGRKFDSSGNPTEEIHVENFAKLKAALEVSSTTENFLLAVPSENSLIKFFKLLEKDPDKKRKNLIVCLAGQSKEIVSSHEQNDSALGFHRPRWGTFQSAAHSAFSEPMLKAAVSRLSRQFKHVVVSIESSGSGAFAY